MKRNLEPRYAARARVLKALAHPTRLFMVEELARGRRCVCELQALIGDDFSTVSKHLSCLKQAGIVRSAKQGTQVIYSLKMPCVASLFRCIENVLQNNLEEQRRGFAAAR